MSKFEVKITIHSTNNIGFAFEIGDKGELIQVAYSYPHEKKELAELYIDKLKTILGRRENKSFLTFVKDCLSKKPL